jgi:signal transduction histidine kinase
VHSIRKRLTLVLAGGFAVLIAGAGGFVQESVAERLVAEFDATSIAKARALISLTDQEAGRIEFDYQAENMPEYERSERPEYFQFWLDDGQMLLRSTRLDRDLPRGPSLSSTPIIGDVTLPDGRAGRMVQLAWVPHVAGDPGDDEDVVDPATLDPALGRRAVVLAVARERESLDRLLAQIGFVLFGAGGVAVALGALLAWRALAAGFRPIDGIAAQVERLDAEGLGSRVALPRAPRELAPIVAQLNALLARLEASFQAARRFAGNLAHELRTPITELRALADVGARWPGDEASVAAFFGDVRDIANRMDGVIADLSLLARCHAGIEQVLHVPVSLRQIVATSWSRLGARASARGLRLRLELPDADAVASDPGKLAIVLGNLLDNAVSHALPGGEIRCAVTRADPGLRIEIQNAAELLTAQDLASLAEPVWRKDPARASSPHAGLGLSLVTALAALLGIEVGFAQDPDGTFRARLANLTPIASLTALGALRRVE